MVCSPSVLNPEGFVAVETDNTAASMGTALHSFFERIVFSGEYDLEEVKAKFPTEQERALQLVTNFFAIWEKAKTTMTSPKVELAATATIYESEDLQIKLTGHIDLCQVGPTSALILDYKTGRVHEDHYHQIAGYAYLLWDYAGRPDVYHVAVAVVYLEDNTIQNYSFTSAQLREWAKQVAEKVNDQRYIVNRKCGYCKIAGACPAYREDREFTFNFLASDDAQKGRVSWSELEPEERGRLLDRLYVFKRGHDRVMQSLNSAMQGKKPGESDRLDIGKGMVYEKVTTVKRRLNTRVALPVLRQRFRDDVLEPIVQVDLDAVLDLAAKYAPRGKKELTRKEWLAKLTEIGAIVEETSDRFQRRPANEKKLEAE